MDRIDRKTFWADLKARTGLTLGEKARAGLGVVLDAVEADPAFTQVRDVAYLLATIGWESGHTFRPIKERRANRERQPDLWAVQERYWPSGFYGRGYVQITWRANYLKAGQRLAGSQVPIDGVPTPIADDTFVKQPDLVLDPTVAYLIAARGMREGWFTGKKLSDFIKDGQAPDYVQARKIINGLNCAKDIAKLANGYELVLRAATATTRAVAAAPLARAEGRNVVAALPRGAAAAGPRGRHGGARRRAPRATS